jgi:hypothetical protein
MLKNTWSRFPVVSAFGVGIAVTVVVFGIAFLIGQETANRRAIPTPMPSFATLTPVQPAALAPATTPIDPTALVFPDTLPLSTPTTDARLVTPTPTAFASPTEVVVDTITPVVTPTTVVPVAPPPTATAPPAPNPPPGGGPKRKPPKH